MQKLQGFVEQGNTTLAISGAAGSITRKVQGSFPSATVTVYINNPSAIAISSISRTANVVTVTIPANSGFIAGESVTIAGMTDASFNGTFTIVTSGATTFTYAQTAANASSSAGTASSTLRLATIYSDNSSTSKANPFTAASDASWFFYAADGRYDIKFSGGSLAAPVTLGDFLLFDAAIGFLQTGTAAINRAINTKMQETFSIADFGAAVGGVTDNASAIQAAIDAASLLGTTSLGIEILIPDGEFALATGVTIAQNKHISFRGTGRTSALRWTGGNNANIIAYLGGASADCQVHIEQVKFVCAAQTGIKAIKVGSNAVATGVSNLTVRKCMFQNMDTALETNKETDAVVFEDNWLLVYHSYGIHAVGGSTNSGYWIKNNHFQGGESGSWAVLHSGGANVVIEDNIIESGTTNAKGISLTNISVFSIKKNYFEVNAVPFGGADGPFAAISASETGEIGNNITTGDTGNSIVTIDGTCDNIKVGPMTHASSGGTPTTFLAVTAGATNIFIVGKLKGATNAYSGTPSLYMVDGNFFTPYPINQLSSFQNVNGLATASLFTLSSGTSYFVYIRQTTESYWLICFVARLASGNAVVTTIYNSNANLTVGVSGNDLQVTNGIGGVRTIEYAASRMGL